MQQFVFAENKDGIKAKQNIIGHVSDANTGEPLEGTKVFIKELNTTVYTDASGNFTFEGYSNHNYQFVLELISYQELEVNSLNESNLLFFKLKEED